MNIVSLMDLNIKKAIKKQIKNPQDLSTILIKDRHGKAVIRHIVFSKVIFTFLLIALQIAFFILFLLRFKSSLEIYFGISLAITGLFMVYLSNTQGKNEFKIAWMLPLLVFPLFGVAAYLLYHLNRGGYKLSRRLADLKKRTEACLPSEARAQELLKNFPAVEGIGRYLLKRGKFFPHTNTTVKYFKSGEEFYPNLLESVKAASKFIFIEFFIIEVDETWAELLKVLEQKVKEGVEVRLLYDGLGSPIASQGFYKKYLRSKGIRTHVFTPLIPFFSTEQNNRDHRKIVIVDGEVAYTGGVNISNEYMNYGSKNRFEYWKDNAIRIEGPAIQNFMMMFLQTWGVRTKTDDDYDRYINFPFPQKQQAAGLIIPYGDDAFNKEDIAEDVYLYIISNAKKYVYITSPYMIIDNQMQEALIFAAHRGVNVTVMVPSVPDHFFTFCIGKTFLKTLCDEGVNVYTYEKGFIHEKTFICDDKVATVGSVNLDYRSLFYHFECGAFMYDMPVISDIKADFESSLGDCRKMNDENYKKIPSYKRVIGRVLRLFAPLI